MNGDPPEMELRRRRLAAELAEMFPPCGKHEVTRLDISSGYEYEPAMPVYAWVCSCGESMTVPAPGHVARQQWTEHYSIRWRAAPTLQEQKRMSEIRANEGRAIDYGSPADLRSIFTDPIGWSKP